MTLFNDHAWDFWAMWQFRSCIRVNQSRREPKSEKNRLYLQERNKEELQKYMKEVQGHQKPNREKKQRKGILQ